MRQDAEQQRLTFLACLPATHAIFRNCSIDYFDCLNYDPETYDISDDPNAQEDALREVRVAAACLVCLLQRCGAINGNALCHYFIDARTCILSAFTQQLCPTPLRIPKMSLDDTCMRKLSRGPRRCESGNRWRQEQGAGKDCVVQT